MNTLKDFFSRLYRAKITNIKITNDLLNKVFPKDNTKKITRHNPNPSENQLAKVSFADPKLSEKQDCIPAGYEDYDVVNTQFIEDIDGTTTGTLGVNCDKGKLHNKHFVILDEDFMINLLDKYLEEKGIQ